MIDDKFLAQSLALEAGYRYSDYNLGFKTNTYKFGLEWSPISELRLRGSFQRAVRAPNVIELFSPQSVALDGNTDPCAGTAAQIAATGITQAQCVAAGVPAAAFGTVTPNSAAQYNGLIGGNPALKPETALTTSFGIGWTPAYVPNLRVQVDYFDIKIENVISTIGATRSWRSASTAVISAPTSIAIRFQLLAVAVECRLCHRLARQCRRTRNPRLRPRRFLRLRCGTGGQDSHEPDRHLRG